MEQIAGILKESYYLFREMAPFLLFGFLFAGIIHIFIKADMISKYLGKKSLSSVVMASVFGIPLPLCSCGVIPAAMSLRKEGASRGAVLSFLISTPTTGVDSILATYSLLGGLFTVYRIIASFVTGVFAGILSNIFIKEEKIEVQEEEKCKFCENEKKHSHTFLEKIKSIFEYAFGELLTDTGGALILGVLIGGGIAFFIPADFFNTYLGSGINAMFVMLLIGIPMYVCATASIPIAAALILKGINPGAAFVFLVAGPATNIVTMAVIAKNMGKKALLIYLSSIIIGSISLGLLLDKIYYYFIQNGTVGLIQHHRQLMPSWVEISASAILFILIVKGVYASKFSKKRMKM